MKTLVAKASLWVSERLGPWASDEWREIGNLKALHSGMFELIKMILDGFIKFFFIAVYSAFISWNINYYIYKTVIRAKFVKKHHYCILYCVLQVCYQISWPIVSPGWSDSYRIISLLSKNIQCSVIWIYQCFVPQIKIREIFQF